jgi:hypothetical protein
MLNARQEHRAGYCSQQRLSPSEAEMKEARPATWTFFAHSGSASASAADCGRRLALAAEHPQRLAQQVELAQEA